MEKRIKHAAILLSIVCVIIGLFGALLLFGVVARWTLLPPMEDLLGMTTAQLNEVSPKIVTFMMRPFAMIAALCFGVAIGVFRLVNGPLKEAEPWARATVFTILGICVLGATTVTLTAYPVGPWPAWLLCTILLVIAFVLSRRRATD